MRVLHPLAGGNLSTVASACFGHRAYRFRYLLPKTASLLAALIRFPFYQIEKRVNRERIAGAASSAAPLFIVGHWRSGTTHLHNLMSTHPQFAPITFRHTALPWDFLSPIKVGSRILASTLPETRGMDNVGLSLDSPQEEEMALGNMGTLCYYYCYYFPREMDLHYRRSVLFEDVPPDLLSRFARNYRYLLDKLAAESPDKRFLLLKNPASTGRLQWLKSIFPNARFIHIYRNPYEVFASTVRHFHKVLPEFALQPYGHLDFEAVTLKNYRLLFERYFEQRELIPQEDLFEVTFERLVAEPEQVIGEIYQYFSLPAEKEAVDSVRSYNGRNRDYQRNLYTLTRRQVDAIKRDWKVTLEPWGYDIPEKIEIVD
jgi:hypothetical protein